MSVPPGTLLRGGEEVSTAANNCKLKVAELSATLENYPLAVEVYEEVAKASMHNNLLKFSVKAGRGERRVWWLDVYGGSLGNPKKLCSLSWTLNPRPKPSGSKPSGSKPLTLNSES